MAEIVQQEKSYRGFTFRTDAHDDSITDKQEKRVRLLLQKFLLISK